MLHHLPLERANLHANFVTGAAPVLTIDSGDTVSLRIPDISWGLEPPTSTTASRRKFEPRDPTKDNGPCLAGPITVRGAKPGDAIEVSIEKVTPSSWGWTYAGKGMATPDWNAALGVDSLTLLRWTLDAKVATSHLGHTVSLRPFPGTIGLAPATVEAVASGWMPRPCGGNMDCRELTAGSTLFLPVMVEGGLLSAGDGHAAQADGEVSGTAIECMLEELRLTLTLRSNMPLNGPRILSAPDERNARRWITLGFGPTLDAAAAMAMSGMLDLMEERYQIPRAECLALASTLVSLRITQLVNPHKGVHAILLD